MTVGRPVPPPLGKPLPDTSTELSRVAPDEGRLVPALGALSAAGGLEALTLARRAPGPEDVEILIQFCGLCHSDVHSTRGEWGPENYPLVPGHEIVGAVLRTGTDVTEFSVGDRVGVGCMVDSCRNCEACLEGLEQYCENGMVGTYGGTDPRNGNVRTQGGYAQTIVVDRRYVLNIPDGLDAAAAAPLLCAGITTYSPLRHAGVEEGDDVGVVGLGGLGHMAVKLAKAMGAGVTVFTTSESKREDALALGADRVVNSRDADQMLAATKSVDVIIDTVAASHDLNPYLRALRRDGVVFQLGLPSGAMPPVDPRLLIRRRAAYAGSLIGGIAETQEMLDFCAEHGVASEIETVSADGVDHAFDRMVAGDVKYRFVLDTSTLHSAGKEADA
ncbi:NAD(P)-dependent alcohol dehydrogenase [Arthrobacter sp. NPDC090010]|uniref:NAD(P)-dependent alcohol dehydrogenase n=1 Tax=Arthrobacter sp. NPDC090010 TaxID=3363942 RepID=UPI003810A0F2